MRLFEAFANIFRVPDLRKRVLFTLALLAVYRLGGHIPSPGINIDRWSELFNSQSGSIFGFFDMFAGGAVRAVLTACGVPNVLTKSIGRRNPHNVVKATIVALESLRDRNAIAEMRGLAVEKL